jgi:hypothetical protein
MVEPFPECPLAIAHALARSHTPQRATGYEVFEPEDGSDYAVLPSIGSSLPQRGLARGVPNSYGTTSYSASGPYLPPAAPRGALETPNPYADPLLPSERSALLR